MARNVKRLDRIDHKIIFVLVSLIIYGLVMIFSIVSVKGNMGVFFKQVLCMVAGLAMMYLFHFAHISILKRLTFLIYPAAYVAILFLLLPSPYTVTANGAKRWINVGGFFSFQVAEFVKLAVILMLALWVEMCKNREDSIKAELAYVIPGWFMGAIPAFLLYKISNDLSSSAVILGITFIITLVSSKNLVSIFLHILFVILAVVAVVMIVQNIRHHMPTEAQIEANEISFRTARIAAWLAPEKYAKTVGFQPLHCLYAVANGGWFGKGLGQSWQKSILPMSDNDVIFAIIIEELGIFGGLVLIFLFGVLVTLMCNVAYNIKDAYNRIIILGVVAHIVLQVLIHCGVCTNTIPNTGIGLPFISSGMTAGFFQLFEMAMVLSITRGYLFEIEKKQGIDLFKFLRFRKKEKKDRNKKNAPEQTGNVAAAEHANAGSTGNSSRSNGPIGSGRSYPRSYREKYGDRLYDRGRQSSARSGRTNTVGRNHGSSVGDRRRYSDRRNDYHNNLRQTKNGEYRGRDNFSNRSSAGRSNNFSNRSSVGRNNNLSNRSNVSSSNYYGSQNNQGRNRDSFSSRNNSNTRNRDSFNSRNNSNIRNRNNFSARNITHFDPNRRD
ncbi:MAG: FtsW/RodA/SpoVE family cell cycle protein [Eubacteriales bacterium]|nr:FtsW/RodA/SpoVE family cell cycle protein [Eubacteriales bacterium]